MISWSPSSRQPSGLTYHCLLTQANKFVFQQVSNAPLNRSHLEPFVNSLSHRNPLRNTNTHTHFWETTFSVFTHPLSACLNTMQSEPDHTQTSYPSLSFLQAKILSYSNVHNQETIHSCSDREINKCREKNK